MKGISNVVDVKIGEYTVSSVLEKILIEHTNCFDEDYY